MCQVRSLECDAQHMFHVIHRCAPGGEAVSQQLVDADVNLIHTTSNEVKWWVWRERQNIT